MARQCKPNNYTVEGYATLDEAIHAREEAEIKYFGDFKYECNETLRSNSSV